MKSLLLTSAILAVISLMACATAPRDPLDRSVVEAVHDSESAPPPAARFACPAGKVQWCEREVGGERCSCVDSLEAMRYLQSITPQ